jgi:hypothetical protein
MLVGVEDLAARETRGTISNAVGLSSLSRKSGRWSDFRHIERVVFDGEEAFPSSWERAPQR